MNYKEKIKLHFKQSADTKLLTANQCTPDIIKSIEIITKCFKDGQKLLICGNGGSAADAQHIAAEFVIRLSHDISRPALPALALTTDSSLLTAGGNDIGFTNVFARQVEAFGQNSDVLLAISTSGNSANILSALETAKKKNMITIGLLGAQGGKAKNLCDISIVIPSDNVQHIQESHITVGHQICELVEKSLFPSK